jgi:hypothetical protein
MAETVVKGSQTKVPSEDNEVILLKAQITSMENHQSQLISIVLWSLSSVIAMALGLAAFNWYTSKVSYEREIQAISQESNAKYQDLHSQLISIIDKQSETLLSELSSKEEGIKNLVIMKLEERFVKQVSMIDKNRHRIVNLEFVSKNQLAEEAMNKGRLEWGIHQYCDLMAISVEQRSDTFQVGDILDKISKALDAPDISLSSDQVNRITAALRKLPENYKSAVENLIPKVNKAHG